MKAIILNSGIGKRMKPFTDGKPKCFAKLNKDTILEHQIKNLAEYGVKDFIITLGPFGSKIKKLMKKRFPKLKAAYIKNPLFNSTNYIYSIFLAKKVIDDDTILMHGDMVFEKSLLGKLLDSKYKNCVLVNNGVKPPEKDFKARIQNGVVKEIGVNVFGKNAFFLPPIYRLSRNGFKIWLKEIKKFVVRGRTNEYAENAFNEISDKIKLRPVYFQKELCMEIDDFDDLKLAKKLLNNKKD